MKTTNCGSDVMLTHLRKERWSVVGTVYKSISHYKVEILQLNRIQNFDSDFKAINNNKKYGMHMDILRENSISCHLSLLHCLMVYV